MTITVITGANKGIGYETARRLVERGHTVYVGARDARRGKEAAGALGARALLLDVTDDASVQAAADRLREEAGHVDVLVNNAGINQPAKPVQELTGPDLQRVYDTNVFGPVRTLHAFLPLLRKAEAPVVVNVSSSLGSLTINAHPDSRSLLSSWVPALAYNSSKAALNMLTVLYAKAHPEIRISAVNPGFTATDLNGHAGTLSVEEGAEIIVATAAAGADAPSGAFVENGGTLPW
ncbi:SDR family NAD(P)-dependent oxidoreductase [Streptomyces sp. NPDC007095]|uniref:SDR family NAD(P)-dependent oxidoreductase n=1 Tax=Streptomyces sp. NPDC007095 TaxID=3154482 RepID=UPI0033F15B55